MILITIPFAWPEHEQPYDFARYTSFGIRSVLEKNDFYDITIVKTNSYLEAVTQLWIEYLSNSVFAKLGFIGKIIRVPFVFFHNFAALLMVAILPEDKSMFSNLLVVSRNRK